jgi:hypothetical protein
LDILSARFHASLVNDGRNSFLFVVFMECDYRFLFVSIPEWYYTFSGIGEDKPAEARRLAAEAGGAQGYKEPPPGRFLNRSGA